MSLTCDPREEVEDVDESLLVGFRSQEEEEEEEEERVVLARAESSWETFLLSPLLLLRMDSTGDLHTGSRGRTLALLRLGRLKLYCFPSLMHSV